MTSGHQTPPVPYVEWDDVYQFLRDNWSAGEHVSIVARTGQGKSHLIGHLSTLWPVDKVLIIDTKSGGDPC